MKETNTIIKDFISHDSRDKECFADNLEVIDTMIIKSLGANALQNENNRLNFEDIGKLINNEFSSKDIQVSLEILKDKNYVDYKVYSNSHKPTMIKLTSKGIICYGENYISNFDEITKEIISLIINDNIVFSKTFFEKIDSSKVIIRAIIEKFSEESYLTLQPYVDGSFKITKINGNGYRWFNKILDKE